MHMYIHVYVCMYVYICRCVCNVCICMCMCVRACACIFIAYGFSKGRKCCIYLMTHSTHFIYGNMASDIWLRTILIAREVTRCRHIGYSYRLAAKVLLHTTAFFTPVVEHWLEREIAQ